MSNMTTVYLIRHGATALNREVPYRLQGRGLNPGLDELGQAQARRAGEALRSIPLTAIYVSPLLRAQQTAGLIAEPQGLLPQVVDNLVEASLGLWEGLTWDQAKALMPELFAAFHANPGTVAYPEGESFLDCQKRMIPTIADLASKHAGERIAIVSHNVTNRAYLAGLLGIPIDRAREIRQSNCGINVIKYEGSKPIVETMNSTFHVEGLIV
jgi:broad specificity phosphatase PhoE